MARRPYDPLREKWHRDAGRFLRDDTIPRTAEEQAAAQGIAATVFGHGHLDPVSYRGFRDGRHVDRKTPEVAFADRPDRKPWQPKPHDDVTRRRMPDFSVPSSEMKPGFNGQRVGRNPRKPRNPKALDREQRATLTRDAKALVASDAPDMKAVIGMVRRLEAAGEIPASTARPLSRLYQWADRAKDKPKRGKKGKPSGNLFKREKTAKSAIGFELLK